MIALDTNLLVRLLVGDDHDQLASVQKFLSTLSSSNAALICREVLIELVWVLERTYGFEKSQVAQTIEELVDSNEVVVEEVDGVRVVLEDYRSTSVDFSDLMIRSVATSLGATQVTTFDKKFSTLDDVSLLS